MTRFLGRADQAECQRQLLARPHIENRMKRMKREQHPRGFEASGSSARKSCPRYSIERGPSPLTLEGLFRRQQRLP